jgi:hypothetical protein
MHERGGGDGDWYRFGPIMGLVCNTAPKIGYPPPPPQYHYRTGGGGGGPGSTVQQVLCVASVMSLKGLHHETNIFLKTNLIKSV